MSKMSAPSLIRPAAQGRRPRRLLLSTAMAVTLGLSLAGCKTSAEKAEEYYQSGMELLEQGDVDRAMVQFRNVFDIEGTHYEARKALAQALVSQDRNSDAYSQYLRLAEQYPDDLDTRIALARMAFRAKNWDEFLRHATRAVELSPDSPEVQALDLARRYQEAREDDAQLTAIATKAAELSKSYPDDTVLLDILLDRAGREDDMAKAGPLIDALIELQPDNPVRYRQRLAYLVQQQDMPAIEAHLLDTIRAFPEDDQAKADLLRFYMSQDQSDKAEGYLRKLAEAAPADNPTPRADLIRFVEVQRGVDAALAEVDLALEQGGDPMIFRVLRAGFTFQQGKTDAAIAELRDVLKDAEASEQASRAKVQLARMLLQTGDQDQARILTDEVLAQNPSEPGALKLKAAWDIDADDTDAAITALRNALDQDPEDTEALSLMGSAYARAGETDLARDFLSQAAKASGNAVLPSLRIAEMLYSEGRYRPAEDALLPALERDSQNVQLLGLLGQVYLAMPDLPRAEGVIARLRDIASPQAVSAAEQLELARLNSQQGQGAALDYLQNLAQAEDAGLGPKLALIRANLSAGETEAALNMAQDLAQTEPDNPQVQMVLAMTRAATGDTDGAIGGLSAIIEADPQASGAYLALARLHMAGNDKQAAVTTVDRGLAARPDDMDLMFAKAGLEEQAGNIDQAIEIYERIYAANSNSIVIANNLASLLATWYSQDAERVQRASAVARRLKDSDIPAFMDTYGWIQHLNGNSAEALPYLEGAAEGLPQDPMVQLHLGLVLNANDRPDAARVQLQKGLEMLAPDAKADTITRAREVLAALENPQAETGTETGDGTGDSAAPADAPAGE